MLSIALAAQAVAHDWTTATSTVSAIILGACTFALGAATYKRDKQFKEADLRARESELRATEAETARADAVRRQQAEQARSDELWRENRQLRGGLWKEVERLQKRSDEQDAKIAELEKDNEYWRGQAGHWQEVAEDRSREIHIMRDEIASFRKEVEALHPRKG